MVLQHTAEMDNSADREKAGKINLFKDKLTNHREEQYATEDKSRLLFQEPIDKFIIQKTKHGIVLDYVYHVRIFFQRFFD